MWSCTPFARAASCTSRIVVSCVGLFGFTSRRDHPGLGNQLGQQLEPLGRQLGRYDADAGEVAARPGEAGDQARARPGRRHRRRRSGSSRSRFSPPAPQGCRRVDDHVDLAADEIGGQCGQPIIVALRPAVFDRHVLSLDVAGFAQSLVERGDNRLRPRPGEPLLRKPITGIAFCCARRARGHAVTAPPSSEHEVAPSHSMTSSARARIDGGTVRPSALAVLRLMTSSNLVGCWTGRSAGLAPLRIFPA